MPYLILANHIQLFIQLQAVYRILKDESGLVSGGGSWGGGQHNYQKLVDKVTRLAGLVVMMTETLLTLKICSLGR